MKSRNLQETKLTSEEVQVYTWIMAMLKMVGLEKAPISFYIKDQLPIQLVTELSTRKGKLKAALPAMPSPLITWMQERVGGVVSGPTGEYHFYKKNSGAYKDCWSLKFVKDSPYPVYTWTESCRVDIAKKRLAELKVAENDRKAKEKEDKRARKAAEEAARRAEKVSTAGSFNPLSHLRSHQAPNDSKPSIGNQGTIRNPFSSHRQGQQPGYNSTNNVPQEQQGLLGNYEPPTARNSFESQFSRMSLNPQDPRSFIDQYYNPNTTADSGQQEPRRYR